MSEETLTRAGFKSLLQNMAVVGIVSALILLLIDYHFEFAKLWDFRVYLRASEHFFETGNPYYEAESLRFIYPPTASFVFYLINDNAFFGSFVFAFNGALWVMTACLFCRSRLENSVVIPALFILFGMQGWVAVLTGNIACLLYFVAAVASLMYHNKLIATSAFAVVILLLTLVKPFYAEFLIFIWLAYGMWRFLAVSLVVVSAFFAINMIFYPVLFEHFLSALQFDRYDTEIYGITLFSHISSFGFNSAISVVLQLLLIGILFGLFVLRLPSLRYDQQFLILFILAVFINPKHITYDLMVAVPALVILLIQSNTKTMIAGASVLVGVSLFDFSGEDKPYFQWWYGYVVTLVLVLISGKFQFDGFWQRTFVPIQKPR